MTQIVIPQYKMCHAMEKGFGQVAIPCQFARLFLCVSWKFWKRIFSLLAIRFDLRGFKH